VRRRRVIGITGFGLALLGGAVLGTAVGSAGSPYDAWACERDRIGTETYSPGDGGGYESTEAALLAGAEFLAADGIKDRSAYEAALASREGPSRYDPETGDLYIDDQVVARLSVTELPDRTWTLAEVSLCMRPVDPEIASPYPTPVAETGS
jgi:hypothetical protein